MEKPFDDIHADIGSQLLGLPHGMTDSAAVREARQQLGSTDQYVKLGQALSRQLRYREAIDAYTEALKCDSEDLTALRLRAGRYLSTLQCEKAICDFDRCLQLGADRLDCLYRMGIAYYYAGDDAAAQKALVRCVPYCDDEMAIAIIYWHTLSASRSGKEQELLSYYCRELAVGHHTAYEMAMRVWAGQETLEGMLKQLEREEDDMEYDITLYGLLKHPDCKEKEALLEKLLRRDDFWPCFAYLAAWNDKNGPVHA